MKDSQKLISTQVEKDIPQFIRMEYPNFVAFIVKYYEWMEKEGAPYHFIANTLNYDDIDRTSLEFLDYFGKAFLNPLPDIIYDQNNIPTLVKNVQQYYSARGSEKAFEFLFRLFQYQTDADHDIEFYYPSYDMLRISDGKWINEKSIKIIDPPTNVMDWEAGVIVGETSEAKAVIDEIILYESTSGVQIAELFLLEFDVIHRPNQFIVGETITGTTLNGDTFTAITTNIFNSVNITDPGKYYVSDQRVTVNNTGDGEDAKVVINNVTKGAVDSFSIVHGGTGYQINDKIYTEGDDFGSGAYGRVKTVDGITGAITDVEMTFGGHDYQQIHQVKVVSLNGSGAVLMVESDSIGKINDLEIRNFGINYLDHETSLDFNTMIRTYDIDIDFDIGEKIVGQYSNKSGIIESWNKRNNVMGVRNIDYDGTLGEWISDTPMPELLSSHTSIVTNSRVYLLGGYNDSWDVVSTVYSTPINPDGTLGTWTIETSLLDPRANLIPVITGNRVYLLGGSNISGNVVSTVYTAPINPDGTLGAWTVGTSLPVPLIFSNVIITNNRVYLVGGANSIFHAVSTVYTAPINSDGTIGSWTTGTSLPIPISSPALVIINNIAYLLGGYNDSGTLSSIYSAPINPDGTLGSWTLEINTLLEPSYADITLITNNKVYLLGGVDSNLDITAKISFAPINPDGTLGSWILGDNSLLSPIVRSKLIVIKNRAYLLGGYDDNYDFIQNILAARINDFDVLCNWQLSTPIPGPLSYSQSLVTNSRVYLLGGKDTTTRLSTVYSAPINPDGTLGAWITDTPLPEPRSSSQLIVIGDTVHLIGGTALTWTTLSSVITAPINPDGTLGSWTSGTSLPGGLSSSQAIVTNSRVYLLGGVDNTSYPVSTVYSAPINPDGTLGTWITETSLPIELEYHQAINTGNRVYLLGGLNLTQETLSTIYSAPINPDGTLGAWVLEDNSLPSCRAYSKSIIINDKVYLIGGYNGVSNTSTIYTAPINPDGTLGIWTLETSLPENIDSHQLLSIGNRIYSLGGFDSTLIVSSKVYTASINTDGMFLDGETFTGDRWGGTAKIYDQSTAEGTLTEGCLCNYLGRYINMDGQISSLKYIQDSYFYQMFSYMLRIDREKSEWVDLVKHVHPAGTIGFSYRNAISQYLKESSGGFIGPRLDTYEFYKFRWQPDQYHGGYIDSFGNTQNDQFPNIIIDDNININNNILNKTCFTFGSEITITPYSTPLELLTVLEPATILEG